MKRIFIAVLMALALLTSTAQPAGARPLLGCDSYLQWPCPGPVIF